MLVTSSGLKGSFLMVWGLTCHVTLRLRSVGGQLRRAPTSLCFDFGEDEWLASEGPEGIGKSHGHKTEMLGDIGIEVGNERCQLVGGTAVRDSLREEHMIDTVRFE